MIGPVSQTGRAMMASLQQAMSKGMPPDQAIQYVKSMATQGVAPLTDLYAMVNQFQRLKQQQVQPPQTPPTIKDQLNMLDQQQRMQGGIAGMLAPPPAPEPMDQGLGAVNAGNMEYPQFVGGGLVAFQEGGLSGVDFSEMSPEQLEMLARGNDMEAARAAIKEQLRRSGYSSPKDLASKLGYTREYFESAARPPGVFKYDSRPLPAYMYDEQGNVRRSEGPVAGIGGLAEVPSSRTSVSRIDPQAREKFEKAREGFRERLSSQVTPLESAVPAPSVRTPFSSPSAAGSAFDRAIRTAREGVQQGGPSVRPSGSSISTASRIARRAEAEKPEEAAKDLEDYEKEIADIYEKRGIGKAGAEYRKYLEEERARGEEERRTGQRLALAQAGFRMAQEAGKPGGKFLSALGAGGEQLASQMQALRREQQANNRSLREAQFRLAQADELQAAGRIKDAMALRKDAQTRYDRAQERAEDNAYRYAVLGSEERRANATLAMQQAVLTAREESDKTRAGTTLAVALQRARGDLSQDFMYQGLLDKARKAQEDGNKAEYEKAMKAAKNYENQFLSPILTEMDSLGTGEADSGAIDWDSL